MSSLKPPTLIQTDKDGGFLSVSTILRKDFVYCNAYIEKKLFQKKVVRFPALVHLKNRR